MAKIKLTITHYKLLLTVKEINDRGYFTNSEGVFKILTGIYDIDTKEFMDNESFGLLTSYSKKRISRTLDMLVKRDYLREMYDSHTKQVFLQISDNGETLLFNYMKKRKTPFSKKEHKINRCIVKIN